VAQEELKVVVKVVLDDAKQKMASFSKVIQGLKQNYLAISFAVKDFYGMLKKVGTFVWDFAEAALEAEKAYTQLGAAMLASGQDSVVMTKQLAGLARALSMTTTYDDDETIGAMQSLTQIGRVSAAGMKQIIPVVQDLAAGLGTDLNSAALMVGRALEGNVASFGKLGIKIKETNDPAILFSNTIEAITGRFGGMAEAMAKSASGGIAQIKNEFAELREAVGNRLLQSFKDTIFGLASMMKSSTILNMTAGDIGSKEEGTAYLQVLNSELERAKKTLDKMKGGKGGFKNPLFAAFSPEAKEATKYLDKLKVKMNEISVVVANMKDIKAPPFLGGPRGDESAEKVKTLEQATSDVGDEYAELNGRIALASQYQDQFNIETIQASEEQGREIDSLIELEEAYRKLSEAAEEAAKYQEDIFLNVNWEQMRANNEAFISQLKTEKDIIDDLNKSFEDMAKTLLQESFVNTFAAIGEAMAGGADASANFSESMTKMINDFISQLPRLLFQAGIMALAQGNTPLGLGLLAASGFSALAGGAIKAGNTPSEGTEQVGTETGSKTIIIQGDLVTENDVTRGVMSRAARW